MLCFLFFPHVGFGEMLEWFRLEKKPIQAAGGIDPLLGACLSLAFIRQSPVFTDWTSTHRGSRRLFVLEDLRILRESAIQ
jgi:hypothetical protein